jgi:hypothetical protein
LSDAVGGQADDCLAGFADAVEEVVGADFFHRLPGSLERGKR